MNKFPCKNCLVKPCCSKYCDDLEQFPKVIDIYIVSLKTCPDCGDSNINKGTIFNKTTKICFACSKVFRQETFVKIPKPKLISTSHKLKVQFNRPNETNIITDINESKYSTPHSPYTMEETHDLLYNRVDKGAADYIIKQINLTVKKELMKKPLINQEKIGAPDWILKKYEKFIGDVPKEDVDIFFK